METTIIQDKLEILRKLLPLKNVIVYEDEMHYIFRTEGAARHYEKIACQLILAHQLPLVTDIAIWRCSGALREANLCVSYAPEMETCD